jgi:hypothetical protein
VLGRKLNGSGLHLAGDLLAISAHASSFDFEVLALALQVRSSD